MTSFIGQTISHYKIIEHLGGGGMGVVFKAHDTKLDRPVALKFLPPQLTSDPEAKQRLIREAKAASALDHKNICVVHDIGETDDGQTFIVMACYEGETLKKKIEREPLKIPDAIELAIQIAQGLQRAHEAGITHRDIKPANIMVTARGEAKIVDFGLANLSGQPLPMEAGVTLGTVAYVSPEQARGDSVDHRTDIWSLGVVLYEMLAGRRPFEEEYENSLLYTIINLMPEPLTSLRSGIPLKVEAVVQKCLSKDPGERYQHMDELLVDLHSCAKDSTARRSSTQLPTRRVSRGRWIFRYTFAILVLIGLGIAGTLIFQSRHGEPSTPHLKMIAVLPFENLGPAEDEYFADGLTDEITSRLGSISSLGVISQTSSMQYKKTEKTLPVIAKELGVDYVLEGRIRWDQRRPDGKMRFTLRLIKVSGDLQLWADTQERALEDIFNVQREIAAHVVASLGLALAEGEKGTLEAIPTSKLDAYQSYLRGQMFAKRSEEANVRMAIELLTHAIVLDSTFASAYAGLSMAHLAYYWRGYDRTDLRLTLAKQALDQAFGLQADLPEAHLALGWYYYLGPRNYEEALRSFSRAQQKLPNDSRIHLAVASVWRLQGRFDEAVDELKKAFLLNPQDAHLAGEIGFTLSALGLYQDAEVFLDRSISLLPDQSDAYLWKSDMYLLWRGDTKGSRKVLEQMPSEYIPWSRLANLETYDRHFSSALDCLTKEPERAIVGQEWVTPSSQLRGFLYRYMGDTARSRASFDSARVYVEDEIAKRPYDSRLHSALGIIYAGLGNSVEAVREAGLAVDLLPISKNPLDGWFPLVMSAHIDIMVGRHGAAIDVLEFLLSLRAPKWTTCPMLRLDPVYDPLRSYPRFQALLASCARDEHRSEPADEQK